MAARVEEIKGTQLERNVSMCVEREEGGIDTTPNQGQFARIGEPGLSFFGLDVTPNSRVRSSLGHTSVSLNGGPVEIFLANESVVENVSWISYEGLVAHELSDASRIPAEIPDDVPRNEQATPPQTTDGLLSQQALANGVSLYVADRYVERYGGHLNVSVLDANESNWKRRVVQSAYSSGYRYSVQTNQRSIPETSTPNSTAQILHPNREIDVVRLPERPNLSIDSVEHVKSDRVGELFLRGTFRTNGVSAERAAAAAAGWTNDRLDHYRADNSTVVSWRVTWQNASERAEFVETYDAVYDYERVEAIREVDCGEPGRYLSASQNAVTVLQCGG
ncbi:hypothetical protein [Halorussus halobius]|uniref:hypothetical protein n=1 Tax=Halorussus halobius TaxID=1710537 RepID=UPI001091BAB6|nr:hypothetical protein [Halorussus halobius]